jgi:hypothetical protein
MVAQTQFFTAAERGKHEQPAAEHNSKHLKPLKEGLLACSPEYLERTSGRKLLP